MNIMVATRGYEEYVREAVLAGTDLIISGAGLPVTLPQAVREAERKSERRAARFWLRSAPVGNPQR